MLFSRILSFNFFQLQISLRIFIIECSDWSYHEQSPSSFILSENLKKNFLTFRSDISQYVTYINSHTSLDLYAHTCVYYFAESRFLSPNPLNFSYSHSPYSRYTSLLCKPIFLQVSLTLSLCLRVTTKTFAK